MANETNKNTTETMVEESTTLSANVAVRDLMASIENLPRTDHMTLPAVMITEIDEETVARMRAVAAINAATDPNTVIDEAGKTLQEVRNEFTFGVSDLNEVGAKHVLEVVEEDGKTGIKITPPEIDGEQQESLTIVSTPANIAPVDANAPHNPVEARVAEGLEADGSEGEATSSTPLPANPGVTTSPLNPISSTPSVDSKPSSGGAKPMAPSSTGAGDSSGKTGDNS